MVITSYSVSGGAEGRRDLRLTIAPDGSATSAGEVVFPHGNGVIVLDVEPSEARCACADPNGNGQPGLIRVEIQARDPRSGDLVAVTLTPAAETEDIDRAGRYEIEVRVDGQPGVVTVLVIPAQRRRKRRSGRRRRR